ncbi:unnamed protein product, partial [Prunus brigantina]
KTPRPTEGGSAQASTPAERRREKRVAEAELVREAHLQATGKRVIEGALDVTPLPKRPRGPNEDVAVLVPDDDEDTEAGPANMEMWFGMKRAVNTAERAQKKFEDGRAKIAEAGKMLQDADRHAEENAAKITELSSKLVEAERAVVDAEEARARAEAERDAALRSQAAARFNVDKKLNLNFLRELPPLPERVTEEMVEAYLGEDAETDSSSGSESSSEDEDAPPEPSSVRETERPAQTAAEAVPQTP